MAQLTVRDVPDETLAHLRLVAEEARTSLNSVVLAAIRAYEEELPRRRALQAALPDFAALRAEILARRGDATSDSAELVREDRGR